MHRIDEPHPFSLETATPHYAEERPVHATHLKLELDLDFSSRSLRGVVTHTLTVVRPVSQLTLDAVDLKVDAVTLDGKKVELDAGSAKQLHLRFAKPLTVGKSVKLQVRYHCTPQRGLYFVGEEQVWTQGQDIDSRHYFPCFDTPAQKAPSEVVVTFPKALVALSNGRLLADRVRGARRTMHFSLEAPHSPYLISVVVGRFEVEAQKAGKTTVRTLFPPGRRDDALRCTRNTPKMIALFERLTGEPYPWGDYAQVFVSEFIFGGMENTSATTLTDTVLHDARAALDYSAEFLIAHELAHQWFGDLLTCRDWPHGWLNEGFATYGEVLWKEESDGLDEADHVRRGDLESYLEEVAERYARPIVARSFDAPIDLFDRHLYEKGGLVLHELRRRLGDADFFASVRAYVGAHAHGSVETVDLARAIERTTGRNVDRFFDEYVFRSGHPSLKAELRYESEGSVRLAITQTQATGPVQRPLEVELMVGTQRRTVTLELERTEHVFHLPVDREPTQVVLDAHRDGLATWDIEKPWGWWRAELLHGAVARARTEAAAALAKDPSHESVAALSTVLNDESAFWGTRAQCAKSLGAIRSPAARERLIAALEVRHPKARRSVVAALGAFRHDARVAEVLDRRVDQPEPSVFVEQELARALGKVGGPTAFQRLLQLLERPAFQDSIRVGAIEGLAELRDPRGWEVVLQASRPGQPPFGRRAAAVAIARLAEVADKKTDAVLELGALLRDAHFRVRLAAIDAATMLGDERLIGPLGETPFLDGREQRLAREAIRTLRAKTPLKELHALRAEVDRLKAELRGVQDTLQLQKRTQPGTQLEQRASAVKATSGSKRRPTRSKTSAAR